MKKEIDIDKLKELLGTHSYSDLSKEELEKEKKELDELLKRDDLSEDSINDINYIIKNINDEIKEK